MFVHRQIYKKAITLDEYKCYLASQLHTFRALDTVRPAGTRTLCISALNNKATLHNIIKHCMMGNFLCIPYYLVLYIQTVLIM